MFRRLLFPEKKYSPQPLAKCLTCERSDRTVRGAPLLPPTHQTETAERHAESSLGLRTVGTHSWESHRSCRRTSERRLFGDDEDEATAYFCSHRKFKNNMLMSAFAPTQTSMARLERKKEKKRSVTHPASLCQGRQKKSPSRVAFFYQKTEKGTAVSLKQFDIESDDTS